MIGQVFENTTEAIKNGLNNLIRVFADHNHDGINSKKIDSGQIFVNRGDSTGTDFTLTKDSTWHTLDISSIVPKDAVLVMLLVRLYSTSSGQMVQFRHPDYSATLMGNVVVAELQVAGSYIYINVLVPASNGNIEYRANSSLTTAEITINGWWK